MKEGFDEYNSLLALYSRWVPLVIATAVTSVFFGCFVFFYDDPPDFLNEDEFSVFDCLYVSLNSIENYGTKVEINVSLFNNERYFPSSALLTLLRVEERSFAFTKNYSLPEFYDKYSNLVNFSFVVLTQSLGSVDFKVKCQNIHVGSKTVHVDRVTNTIKGCSLSYFDNFNPFPILRNAYVTKNTLALRSPSRVSMNYKNLIYGDVEVISQRNFKASNNSHQAVLLLSSIPKKSVEFVLDVMIPVVYYFHHENVSGLYSTVNIDGIRSLLDHIAPGINIVSEDFSAKKLIPLPRYFTSASLSLEDERKTFYIDKIFNLSKDFIQILRGRFSSKTIYSNVVLVDKRLEINIESLKKEIHDIAFDTVSLSEDFLNIIRKVSESFIFVVFEPDLYPFILFKNAGTVIEVPSYGSDCIRYGAKWAELAGLNYIQLNHSNIVCKYNSSVELVSSKLEIRSAISTPDLVNVISHARQNTTSS